MHTNNFKLAAIYEKSLYRRSEWGNQLQASIQAWLILVLAPPYWIFWHAALPKIDKCSEIIKSKMTVQEILKR